MFRRRARPHTRRTEQRTAVDHGTAAGARRLPDGDVVPVPGYRRYADILNGPTRELPVVDVNDPLRMTPGQEYRSGRRRWLP